MILGFTGTSKGMTQRQAATVHYLFGELKLTVLHHGDCVGADAQADRIVRRMGGILIVIHPPSDEKVRSFCNGVPPHAVREEKPYLARNRDIVAEGVDGLIAAPKDFVQPKSLRGQGTWTTVGYARKAGRRIWIVFPDGTFKEEHCDEGRTAREAQGPPVA